MKRLLTYASGVLLLSIALVSNSMAEIEPHPDSCPVITIDCLSGSTCCGSQRTLAANVSGGYSEREPTFKWNVSAGTITKGQGTSSIEIDALNGELITVTVEIGNIIPDGCPTTESYITECSKPSNIVSRARPCRGKRKN